MVEFWISRPSLSRVAAAALRLAQDGGTEPVEGAAAPMIRFEEAKRAAWSEEKAEADYQADCERCGPNNRAWEAREAEKLARARKTGRERLVKEAKGIVGGW